jgi:hypothetical protein
MAKDRSSESANPPARPRHWRRWIVRIGIVLLIYTLIGFFVMPLIVRSVAVSQLRKLLDREVAIEKVRLNPFSFVAEVDGFSVKDPDGEPLLAWQHVRADFQFTSIFLGPWRVREISVVQPYIRAQINPDYRFNFSDLIEKYGKSSESEETASESGPLPIVVIDRLEIRDAAASYADLTAPTPFRRRLDPVNLRAHNFSTAAGHTNAFQFEGATDAGGQFSFAGSLLLTPPEVQGQFEVQGLNLANVSGLYQDFVHFRINDGSIALSTEPHIRLGSNNRLVQATNTRFTLRSLKVGLRDAERAGNFEGEVLVSKLKTTHGANNANLLLWDALNIRGIKANLVPMEAVIDQIHLDGPQLWGLLHADGTVNVLTAANVTNATIHLSDEWSEPDARITVNPLHGVVNHLSTTNLQSGEFQFAGKLEPAGSFTMEGTVRPLDGPEATRVHLTSEGVDLTPTSPYTQRFLGYKLDRGSVNAELQYEIVQRQLVATNHLILDQLTLGDQVDSPDAIKAPVKLGIKLLKDRDGRIELTVPLAGSIDDPQFNIGKVIADAFTSMLTKVITSPLGALGGLVGTDEEDALDQLTFPPGESTLSSALAGRAAKIEQILYERPDLMLELLGTADPAQDAAFDPANPNTQAPGVPAKPQPDSNPAPVPGSPKSDNAAHEAYARALAQEFLESRAQAAPTTSSEVQAAETRTDTTPLPASETGEAQLRQLAKQRAEAVRAALLDSGRIEPGRITVKELTGLPPVGTEVRLTLQ